MDKVYRVHQKDQLPEEGSVVTEIALKSIITKPLQNQTLPPGDIVVLGAAYAGEARIASVTDLIPGASFYEREIGEMLHLTFDGHPDPRPLLLPDDWNGDAPLRREFSLERGDGS